MTRECEVVSDSHGFLLSDRMRCCITLPLCNTNIYDWTRMKRVVHIQVSIVRGGTKGSVKAFQAVIENDIVIRRRNKANIKVTSKYHYF